MYDILILIFGLLIFLHPGLAFPESESARTPDEMQYAWLTGRP